MKHEIVINHENMEIVIRKVEYDWSIRNVRAQLRNQTTNIYVFIDNESVLNNLMNRRQRPYTIWKKELLPVVAELIREKTGFIMDEKRTWKQKLGCTCGCSPGFSTTVKDKSGYNVSYNIWITLKE